MVQVSTVRIQSGDVLSMYWWSRSVLLEFSLEMSSPCTGGPGQRILCNTLNVHFFITVVKCKNVNAIKMYMLHIDLSGLHKIII